MQGPSGSSSQKKDQSSSVKAKKPTKDTGKQANTKQQAKDAKDTAKAAKAAAGTSTVKEAKKSSSSSASNPKASSMKDHSNASGNGKGTGRGPKAKKDDRRSESNAKSKAQAEAVELDASGELESPSRKERGQPKASFPLTRIKMIMKSAPEVNTLGVDAVALTARAAELFVVHLAKQALKKGRSNTVDYADVYRVVHDNPILDFLYDIIPQKVPYKECLAEMQEVERKHKEEMDLIEI